MKEHPKCKMVILSSIDKLYILQSPTIYQYLKENTPQLNISVFVVGVGLKLDFPSLLINCFEIRTR